jgi:hypothetical protein
VRTPRQPVRLSDALGLGIAVTLLTACLALVFLAMRAVMAIGGACADGGPFVSAQPCPDGVPLAMVGGIFGIFAFAALVWRFGAAIGEPFSSLPFLTWPALFCSLGWNFLEYGLFAPLGGEEIIWGFLIPGVLFEIMGIVPLIGLIGVLRSGGGSPKPGRSRAGSSAPARPSISRARPSPPTSAREAALSGLASSFGIAANLTAASARLGGVPDPSGAGDLDVGPAAALVDRIEALADLREKGLLEEREYEAAKAAVLRDLEALQ